MKVHGECKIKFVIKCCFAASKPPTCCSIADVIEPKLHISWLHVKGFTVIFVVCCR